MPSIFTRILQKEVPSYKIAESDRFYAFLDVSPLALGHTLVIPKVEIDYIFEVEDELLMEMVVFAKKVAKCIEKVVDCERIGVSVIGLEVPHCHIHLIPINSIGDMNFLNPRKAISPEQMESVSSSIRHKFNESYPGLTE